jgi:hypothetical protein
VWRPTTTPARTPENASSDRSPSPGGVEPLDYAIGRLGLCLRFVWAFHAREVRFERNAGEGFVPVFPETFSFHPERHDPAELQLQLEDLWANPRRASVKLRRRDGEEWIRGLLAAIPAYLERTLERLEGERIEEGIRRRVSSDALVLCRILARFLVEKGLETHPDTRLAALHLRKLIWRTAWYLARTGVPSELLQRQLAGPALHARSAPPPSDTALVEALAHDRGDVGMALITAVAERAFHRWLEEVCLDESNAAFEGEDSPFLSREAEILQAVATERERSLRRPRDLSPFLRRPANRDCLRLLGRLEVWFLRQYDVHHASAVIHQAERLRRGQAASERLLSRHSTRNYVLAILLALSPFLAASIAYERAPFAFDLVCSAEVVLVHGAALWFLLVRFCWKKNLSLFHASVPRIGAGIIVGYLPVFLIDEVWDLAGRPWFPLGVIVALLGFTTLLYLYVEVQHRIGDPGEAFTRAWRIFLLGLLQALLLGLIMTSLLGSFMVSRTWGGVEEIALGVLRETTPPFVGELPRVVGLEPVVAFPSAVLLMMFLSFFIGTFLQLLWEDMPITEPLGSRPSGGSGIQPGTFRSSGETR